MMSGGLAAFASVKENKMIEDKIMKTNLFEVKQLEKGTNLYFFLFILCDSLRLRGFA